MPSRRASAQATRDKALHALKQAAVTDAELDLTDVWEEGRQFFASARALAEQISRWADDGERLCADRQASAFLRLDARPATTGPEPREAS
jgi:hypothetical protein